MFLSIVAQAALHSFARAARVLMKGFWNRTLLLSLAVCFGAHGTELQLVTGDDYAPLTGRALSGGGMLTAVVQAALDRSGTASSLAWQPWKRGYIMTLRGEYDATYPYIRAKQREQAFLYSAPLYVSEQHLFSRATDAVEVDELAGSSGRRLCLPLGWQLPVAVQSLVDQGVLVRHSPRGLNECALLLLLGRDDFFLADLQLGLHALQSTGAARSRFHVSGSVLSRQTMHLIVPRSRPDAAQLIESFDRGLQALRESGDYQRLIESFTSDEVSRRQLTTTAQ